MSEQLNQAQLTAPETIYLQHNDSGYMDEPFPADHSGTSWCDEEIFNCDVRYVRADIAEGKQAELQVRIAELEAEAAIGRRAVKVVKDELWTGTGGTCISCGYEVPKHSNDCDAAAILRDAEQAAPEPATADAVEALRELLAASDAVIKRWHTPLWKDARPTAEYIAALRLAAESARKLLEG